MVHRRINHLGHPVLEDPRAEIAAMEALGHPPPGHPNVLKVIAAGQDATWAYLVMEHAAGGDVLEAMGRAPLSEAVVRLMMRSVLRGVAYMHARGVAHRDLSLENVLIASELSVREVKIMDFGLTLPLMRDAATGAVLQTPGGIAVGKSRYYAPEVCARARRRVDA